MKKQVPDDFVSHVKPLKHLFSHPNKNVCGIVYNPAGNYMWKVNNGNTRTRCEMFSKLTIKTPERRHC